MNLRIMKVLLKKGETGTLSLDCNDIESYSQVQVEIYDTSIPNQKAKLSFGTAPTKVAEGRYDVPFDASSLREGIYEIKMIRLHTPLRASANEVKDFLPTRDFERTFFEVASNPGTSRSHDVLKEEIENREQRFEEEFNSGIDISKGDVKTFVRCFALIKGLKLGQRYTFSKFEIFPLNQGLESRDELNLTNAFLQQFHLGITFPYDEQVSMQSQSLYPVAIVHFPLIITDTVAAARDFVIKKIKYLLQAFSLTRGANAQLFDIVCIESQTGIATRFSSASSYKGNLLTGRLSGEDPSSLQKYIENLETDSFKSFLVRLHKEAIQEESVDFKFLRYWNILEILATSKNYNEGDNLLNHDGSIVFAKDGTTPLKVKGSTNTVFNLLRENGTVAFENVQMWFALRNAVAHFGTIWQWEKLARNREHAESAINIISSANGHNPILFDLKETVKLVLMRELN